MQRNRIKTANEVWAKLCDFCIVGAKEDGVSSAPVRSVVCCLSLIVFAPNFAAGTPAQERSEELTRSIQKCKDDEPFRKVLDNEVGQQILTVVTSKLEQLKKTMKTSIARGSIVSPFRI